MKKRITKIFAILLALLMLMPVLPVSAFASLLRNDAGYNKQILRELTEAAGSEDEAQAFYDVMENYGLLDEDGNLLESWPIQLHGRDITLDKLRELLAGDYDPEDIIWVDDLPVTLENVKTIIEIEDYIAHVKETYFTEKKWTEEQLAGYRSLMKQATSTGLSLVPSSAEVVGSAGVNHAGD